MSSNKQNGIKKSTSSRTKLQQEEEEKKIGNAKKDSHTSKANDNNIRTKIAKNKEGSSQSSSSRVSKSQYFPNKPKLYSNVLNNANVTPKITNNKPASNEARGTISTRKSSSQNKNVDLIKNKSPKTSPLVTNQPKPTLTEVKRQMRTKLRQQNGRPAPLLLENPSISSTSQASNAASKLTNVEKNENRLKKDSLKVKKDSPKLKKDSPKLKKESPKLKKDSPNISSSENSVASTLERPRTATLKRGTVISKDNPVGPEDAIKDAVKDDSISKNNDSDTFDYEDDFESYASDFEEYQPSSSASSTDSSNLHLIAEDHDEGTCSCCSDEVDFEKEVLLTTTTTEERKLDSGTFELPTNEDKRKQILEDIQEKGPNCASLSDEGFNDDEKSSLQFINFVVAQQKARNLSTAKKRSKRGVELSSMILLNQQNFTLFDSPAVSYDVFIKSFGNRNGVQVTTQTGDDYQSEEVQTEVVTSVDNATQFPIDIINDSKEHNNAVECEYNEYNLERFLREQERFFGDLLEETRAQREFEIIPQRLPFSDARISLNTQGLPKAQSVYFLKSKKHPKILSLHSKSTTDGPPFYHIGCIWDIARPSIPETRILCHDSMSTACFAINNDKIVFAGLNNGGLAAWDLQNVDRTKLLPCYNTEIDLKMCSRVVKVECVQFMRNSNDYQILSLHESGSLTIWGLFIKPEAGLKKRQITLVKSRQILLNTLVHPELVDLQCTDVTFSSQEPNHLLISTNYGIVIHALANGNGKAIPPKYFTDNLFKGVINCVETNASKSGYFLVGCANGNVCLLTRSYEKPLMVIGNQTDDALFGIKKIKWSHQRPCIFYAVDTASNLLVWDLNISELFASASIHVKEGIVDIQLSHGRSESSYLAVLTENGEIYLHILNKEHGLQSEDVFAEDLRRFSNYVDRLT